VGEVVELKLVDFLEEPETGDKNESFSSNSVPVEPVPHNSLTNGRIFVDDSVDIISLTDRTSFCKVAALADCRLVCPMV
jgi:hypothetical protein